MTTRREVLMAMGAAGVGALVPGILRAEPLKGVGIQLYTLRQAMQQDQPRTLERISQLGYTEIEWWGDYGRTPTQMRALLDSFRLSSPAWHVPPELLAPDKLNATLDTAAAMGHRHMIVAWLPPGQHTEDGVKRVADLLSAAGERGASVGIRTGYHNHDFEFTARVSGGKLLWDVLVEHSDARFVDLELDCFWAFKAGHDPIALIQRLSNRITHLHLKDSTAAPAFAQRDLGEGVIDWRRLLTVATAGRVRNVFVERDDPQDPWVTAEVGRRYLRTLGY
jgi:sugar phosphate isomerase/epimerase